MKYITNSFILNYTDSSWANLVDLSEESMGYLWNEINNANNENISYKSSLAGNISRSLLLKDSKKLISQSIIPEILQTQPEFYHHKLQRNLSNPNLSGFWVNYQKKHEFNPIHSHGGAISFVIWMEIPYSWENEVKLSIAKDSNTHNTIGNFVFVYSDNNNVQSSHITMSPEMNGKMAIFPSYFNHMVYPFYTSDEFRISISGNIEFV